METVEKGEEDRISALPDCLIIEILSGLSTTKEAIRTGILSTRWKLLWTLLPTLIFEHTNHNLQWSDFVSSVDKTVTQCRLFKLKQFEVYTSFYTTGFELQVNNWIRYAIRCNVEELNLAFLNVECDAEFLLYQFFFNSSCFTNLRLTRCIFIPNGAISWKSLRSLCITIVKIEEDLIENILSGSPVLETLVLEGCYGYRVLNITSKSVKKLVLSGYMDLNSVFGGDIIKINAPNIKSLTIQGSLLLWELLLVNVASLAKAKLDYIAALHCKTMEEEMLEGMIINLRHVNEIKIGVNCSKVVSCLEAKGFAIPSNMKLPDAFYERMEQGDLSHRDSDAVEEVLLLDDGPNDNEVVN